METLLCCCPIADWVYGSSKIFILNILSFLVWKQRKHFLILEIQREIRQSLIGIPTLPPGPNFFLILRYIQMAIYVGKMAAGILDCNSWLEAGEKGQPCLLNTNHMLYFYSNIYFISLILIGSKIFTVARHLKDSGYQNSLAGFGRRDGISEEFQISFSRTPGNRCCWQKWQIVWQTEA